MAVICRGCLNKMDRNITVPPVRTRRAPCDYCGSTNEINYGRSKGMNFDLDDRLLPGSPEDPNTRAEREEVGRG